MKEIVDLARQENITTILIQRQIDWEMAMGVASEIDGQVVVIDPWPTPGWIICGRSRGY